MVGGEATVEGIGRMGRMPAISPRINRLSVQAVALSCRERCLNVAEALEPGGRHSEGVGKGADGRAGRAAEGKIGATGRERINRRMERKQGEGDEEMRCGRGCWRRVVRCES